jgi:ABC-type nitrate/sulfonate/bicarbonate transport system substrate-binding protein
VGPEARQAPDLTTLNIGATGSTANDWPLMVGINRHLFEDRGIKLEIHTSQNPPSNVLALVAGDLQLVSTAPDTGVVAVEKGAPLTSIAGVSNRVVMRMVAQPSIAAVDQLRGQTLAVSRTKGPDAAIFQDWLGAAGIPATAYTFISNGGSANRIAAVTSGAAAAALVTLPEDIRALDEGLHDLGLNVSRTKPLQFNVLWAERNWLNGNADVARRLLSGLVEAHRWLNDAANRAEAINLLADYANLSPDAAGRVYDTLVLEVQAFPNDAEIDLSGFQNVLQYLADFGDLPSPAPPVERYVDLSFLPGPATGRSHQ